MTTIQRKSWQRSTEKQRRAERRRNIFYQRKNEAVWSRKSFEIPFSLFQAKINSINIRVRQWPLMLIVIFISQITDRNFDQEGTMFHGQTGWKCTKLKHKRRGKMQYLHACVK